MSRKILGILLIAHGLAHASAGLWATDIGGRGLVTVLWELAAIGFIAAGLGNIGVPFLYRRWRPLVLTAAFSSLALLLLYGHPLFVAGIVADFLAIAVAIWTLRQSKWDAPAKAAPPLAQRVMLAFLVYVAVVIGLRPWYSSWGSTRSEQQMSMFGDPPIGMSHYRIDHAITINAPADSVWGWLVQIGQDRAGFYSYDWLERAFGDNIRNADRVVPEWQGRKVGDLVRATQPGYLGGIFGDDLGWRVSAIEPGRALVLEGWGSFVLDPIDANTTRMHIRTRGEGIPTLGGVAITPIGLLVLEPAHFIMERAMLLGIKSRAEKSVKSKVLVQR